MAALVSGTRSGGAITLRQISRRGYKMEMGGDAFGALGWGLRKYAWLVILFVLALGLMIPALLSQSPKVYESKAQVGLTSKLQLGNVDPVPRIGARTFTSGAVADAVRAELGGLSPSTDVIPNRVELVTAQDDIGFVVIGRSTDADMATRLANVAAASFLVELNNQKDAVGDFSILHGGDAPVLQAATLTGPLSYAIGALAGLVAGVGAIAALLAWRRPVIDAAGAEHATGTPVYGRVRLTGRGAQMGNIPGVAPLCRRLVASGAELVLLTSHPRSARERGKLATAISRVLGTAGPVHSLPAGSVPTVAGSTSAQNSNGARSPAPTNLVIVNGPTPGQVATRPDTSVTLLLVEEGVGLASLHRTAEEYLDGGPAGVVFLSRMTWVDRLRPRSRRQPREAAEIRPDSSNGERPITSGATVSTRNGEQPEPIGTDHDTVKSPSPVRD